MVNVAKSQTPSFFMGDSGVKSIFIGNERIYERPGGYVYLVLDTKTEGKSSENNDEKE